MKELKTVGQLKEFLSNFRDDCGVMINIGGMEHEIEGYGWYDGVGADTDEHSSVEYGMHQADVLDLEVNCKPES